MVAAVERVEIGEHCMLANGCLLTDGNHRFDDPDKPVPWQGFTTKGPTVLGDNVWLGANVVVTSGVTIGRRSIIGANSVVTEDVAPFSIAAGAPAKVLRSVEYPGDGASGSPLGAAQPGASTAAAEIATPRLSSSARPPSSAVSTHGPSARIATVCSQCAATRAVDGGDRPAVVELLGGARPEGDHRLDRQRHARLQLRALARRGRS